MFWQLWVTQLEEEMDAMAMCLDDEVRDAVKQIRQQRAASRKALEARMVTK